MHAVIAVIGIGWIVFWLGWLAAALTAKSSRGRLGRLAGARAALAVLVVIVVRLTWSHGRGPSLTGSPVLAGLGLALWVAGLALAIWARICIGRNWGMPMTRRQDPDLVTGGPYRTIRHPIYTGIIAALAGTALAISRWGLIAVALIAAFFVYSAYREEGFLAREFPGRYPAYRARTKMLIPFLF
jgi:protein-S-isoprenylcysteine O-methyltransferase Ste14